MATNVLYFGDLSSQSLVCVCMCACEGKYMCTCVCIGMYESVSGKWAHGKRGNQILHSLESNTMDIWTQSQGQWWPLNIYEQSKKWDSMFKIVALTVTLIGKGTMRGQVFQEEAITLELRYSERWSRAEIQEGRWLCISELFMCSNSQDLVDDQICESWRKSKVILTLL